LRHLPQACPLPGSTQIRDAVVDAAPLRANILLVVDQLEELLTQCPPATRRPYLDAILRLVDEPTSVRVIATMRRDYYNLISDYPEFHRRIERSDEQGRQAAKDGFGLAACDVQGAGADKAEEARNDFNTMMGLFKLHFAAHGSACLFDILVRTQQS